MKLIISLKLMFFIIHYMLSKRSEFQYISWSASYVFFFLLFKLIQVYPMKACWKSKSLKCRECCIMGCFDLCTGVEERSNSKQQSSLEVEQQTVHNWIITHRTSGSLDCCLGDTVNPNVSRSSQQRVRSCFRWYCCPAAACLMSLPSC